MIICLSPIQERRTKKRKEKKKKNKKKKFPKSRRNSVVAGEIVSTGFKKKDIISQLQEQVNSISATTFNAFGTLQRDAPPVQLSPNYPEPPATTTTTDDASDFPRQPKQLGAGLVKAAKQFDALVPALPLSEGDEEAQLKRITELQAEHDVICQELQKQLGAAEKELKQVQELFGQAADSCLDMKKPK